MRYRDNGAQPVYAPNSFGGPRADARFEEPGWAVSGEIGRTAYLPHREDDDFVQPRELWLKVLSEIDRDHLVSNIVGHVKGGVQPDMIARVVTYWTNVHPDLGQRVARGVGFKPAIEASPRTMAP
jgi:catalase